MNTKDFFEQLDACIAKYDLLCHPFYQAWAKGELTREDLRAYGEEYFHHVASFPSYLIEFASRLPDDNLRRAVLANRDDEMGVRDGRAHSEFWLDFVEGLGGERQTNSEASIAEIRNLINWFHEVSREGTPEEALAAFYAYESQVPRVATEKARGLRRSYAADEKTCGYFTLHATADIYHSHVWRSELANIIERNPATADRALSGASRTASALWGALDGIEAGRLTRAA